MGLAKVIMNDQEQRELSVSWPFTRGGLPTATVASCELRPTVMCVYIVPEEGEERRSGHSHLAKY